MVPSYKLEVVVVEVSEWAEQLLRLGSATLGESGGAPCHPRLKAVWPGAALAAPAYTAECPDGDNLALHVGVVNAPAGSVLVGRAADYLGNWGEVLATGARAAGLAGLVLDGGVRDVDGLRRLGFPVFAAAVVLPGAVKVGPGAVGGPVEVGGVVVNPGDWVVADVDGVVIIAAGKVAEVLEAGLAREAKEAGMLERLRAGETTVGLLGLDASLIKVA